ncbi:MAG TPA: hypothetical protein PKL84_12420, partial [Candidatus Hydrogenedentes bacterium]|nr:hypothetical protein [Candidatus Hydrogenedentota bacterium]
ACSVLVGNLDTPYVFLEWGGYLDAVEPHLNTAPLFHTWLMRAPYQYVGVNTPFHVIASRTGASQSELYGENFAERRFDGLVLPPPRYTMSIAKHPDAADLLLSGPDSDGSEDLRRDMAENPQAGPQTYLHEIVSETSDNSVCVDYRVVSQTENTLVPINLDFMSFWHRVMLEYFNGLGYDIFIVDHIYDVEDRPPPDGPEYNGVYAVGIDSIDFIIMAAREIAYDGVDTKQVFFHEIGHCVGLRHNEVNEGTGPPVFPKNLMRSIYANMGMDVNIMFDQSAKMADGSSNWND